MSGPILFISHFKVMEGKLDDFKKLAQAVTADLQANRPDTVMYLQFLGEDETSLTIVHAFPDADAFGRHLEGERARAAFEFIVPTRRELYGMPSEQAQSMLKPPEGSGIQFDHMPHMMGGYLRFKPGE